MKTSRFTLITATAMIFLLSICGSQIVRSDSSSKSERFRQQMAERASKALLVARNLAGPDTVKIVNLLLQEKFEEFEKLSKQYENAFSENPLYEPPLFKLYEALDPYNGNLQEKLDKWVKERPSYISYAARGAYKMSQGCLIRGNKFAADTPPDNFLGMRLFFQEAKPDLLRAIELNKKFLPPYSYLIGIEKAEGNINSTTKIHDLAVHSIPETYYIRYEYLTSLYPKWGGSFELMHEYVDGLDRAAQKNPRIWSLKGEVAAELGNTAWLDNDYMSAIQFYTEALSYGDRMSFLKSRGRLYMLTGQDNLALEDFMKYRKYNDGDRVVNAYVTSLSEKLGINSPQTK